MLGLNVTTLRLRPARIPMSCALARDDIRRHAENAATVDAIRRVARPALRILTPLIVSKAAQVGLLRAYLPTLTPSQNLFSVKVPPLTQIDRTPNAARKLNVRMPSGTSMPKFGSVTGSVA